MPPAEPRRPASPDDGGDAHLDNRGLEPPHPMVRTLLAYEHLRPGGRLTIHNDRVPAYLLPQLDARGARYEVREQADGSAVVFIEKPRDDRAECS